MCMNDEAERWASRYRPRCRRIRAADDCPAGARCPRTPKFRGSGKNLRFLDAMAGARQLCDCLVAQVPAIRVDPVRSGAWNWCNAREYKKGITIGYASRATFHWRRESVVSNVETVTKDKFADRRWDVSVIRSLMQPECLRNALDRRGRNGMLPAKSPT